MTVSASSCGLLVQFFVFELHDVDLVARCFLMKVKKSSLTLDVREAACDGMMFCVMLCGKSS